MTDGRQEMTHERRGMALLCLFLAAAMAAPAQEEKAPPDAVTFTNLFSFNGKNGSFPAQNVVQGLNGNLYGTASFGGSSGSGTVFKLTPGGVETTFYSFCSQPNCPDGFGPDQTGALALDPHGNLYGTTGSSGPNGWGTIFKIAPGGALTTLYGFCGDNCGGPGTPYSGLVRGADGNLYSLTAAGGVNSNTSLCGFPSPDGGQTCGAAIRVTPQGAVSVIYSFCSQPNCADGAVPTAQLISGSDGNLYGTTVDGGSSGFGVVFKLTLSGKLTVLHSFDLTDGGACFPCAPLVQANNGNLYGTSMFGGTNGFGTFFEVTPSGKFTTLYNFCSQANCADGAGPYGFVQGTDGNFYGVTNPSATNLTTCGTLFKITPQGTLTTLYSFSGSDGCYPTGLVQHTNGSFYGETTGGGAGDGTLFRLSVGLKPFVRTLELSGKVGASIQILGTNLTGATAVSFNGVAAAFTVNSATLISATVPAGATTGVVTVTTPAGTLKSNTRFRVK